MYLKDFLIFYFVIFFFQQDFLFSSDESLLSRHYKQLSLTPLNIDQLTTPNFLEQLTKPSALRFDQLTTPSFLEQRVFEKAPVSNSELIKFLSEQPSAGSKDSDLFESLLQKVIQNGMINSFDNNGTTSLIAAIKSGNAFFVRRLLEVGADPNQRKKNGLSPLIFAIAEGTSDMVQILLDNENIQAAVSTFFSNLYSGEWSFTPLQAAILKGDLIKVEQLLRKYDGQKGVDIDGDELKIKDYSPLLFKFYHPLRVAITFYQHNPELQKSMIELLLKYGRNAVSSKCLFHNGSSLTDASLIEMIERNRIESDCLLIGETIQEKMKEDKEIIQKKIKRWQEQKQREEIQKELQLKNQKRIQEQKPFLSCFQAEAKDRQIILNEFDLAFENLSKEIIAQMANTFEQDRRKKQKEEHLRRLQEQKAVTIPTATLLKKISPQKSSINHLERICSLLERFRKPVSVLSPQKANWQSGKKIRPVTVDIEHIENPVYEKGRLTGGHSYAAIACLLDKNEGLFRKIGYKKFGNGCAVYKIQGQYPGGPEFTKTVFPRYVSSKDIQEMIFNGTKIADEADESETGFKVFVVKSQTTDPKTEEIFDVAIRVVFDEQKNMVVTAYPILMQPEEDEEIQDDEEYE
ncbi:ankyrin repeat domain-containing protein [Candidatus Dependentiae bacterium]|nr:ankyrin repeat domain-containing protein [Candidatus Dependentiae bacterium]